MKHMLNLKSPVSMLAVCIWLVLNTICCSSGSQSGRKNPTPLTSAIPISATSDIWAELLQKKPFPHTAPLPPALGTALDGTYTKLDPKKAPPVPCRRCPDYMPEGGIWKLNLDRGVFRIFHELTGWRSIGSFVVDAERIQFFNDPYCLEVTGSYHWTMEAGHLKLHVVEDSCAVGLRAVTLTKLPWLSCQPLSIEAGLSDHGSKPPGCD